MLEPITMPKKALNVEGPVRRRGASATLDGQLDRSLERDILIYGINYAPEMIGVGRYSGEIGAYLAGNGHRIKVITAPPHYPGWSVKAPFKASRYSTAQDGNTVVIRCPIMQKAEMRGIWRVIIPLSFAISSAPLVLWHILRHRPDVVLCVEPTLLAAPAALLAAKLSGARTVLHVQDLEIDAAFALGHLKGGMLKKLAGLFERVTRGGFDRVITISYEMRKRLASKGVPEDRLTVLPNWVDLETIKPLEGPNSYRVEMGLGPDSFVALYSGNIGVKQALHIMLDAAEQLKARSDIVFLVVGDGPEKARLVRRYGSLPNVRFLPLQPEHRLCELLNAADLHVLPQDQGAADLVLPSKLGGMLASGRPIVVTAAAGTELGVFLDGAAIRTDPGDSQALAAAIAGQSARPPDAARDKRLALARRLSKTGSLPRFEREMIVPS